MANMAYLTCPPSDVRSFVRSMVSLRVDNLPHPYSVYGEDVKTSFEYLKTYVKTLFEKYGDIGDIYFPIDRSGKFRGYAFVRYFNKSEAEDALHALEGRKVGGRELRIKIDKNLPL